ncbi:MAG: homoserine kinase [Clostridia bacterium]
MKVKIKVPATTANMGAGFDCLGAALSLYNTIIIESWHENKVVERGNQNIRFSENNMIYKSFKFLVDITQTPCPYIKIYQNSKIPVARGLGSSSACICAGLYAGNMFLNNKFSQQQLLNFAAQLEGHPDNIAPAILGGFVISLQEDDFVYYKKSNIKKNLKFATFVPSFHLKTESSRDILPKNYSKKDTVSNIASASFFTASLFSGNYENLKIGTKDSIHQPYRLPLIKNSDDIFDISYSLGAKAVYLSGAGSAIIALIDSDNKTFKTDAIEQMIKRKTEYFYLHILSGENFGIKTEVLD